MIVKKRKDERTGEIMKKSNPKALMPIGVFLVLYLGLGIVFFEYVMKIPMGFLQHSNCTLHLWWQF